MQRSEFSDQHLVATKRMPVSPFLTIHREITATLHLAHTQKRFLQKNTRFLRVVL